MDVIEEWDYIQNDLVAFEEYIKLNSISFEELISSIENSTIKDESVVFSYQVKLKLDEIERRTGKRLSCFSNIEYDSTNFYELFRVHCRAAPKDLDRNRILMQMYVEFAFEMDKPIIFFLEKKSNHFSDFLYKKECMHDEFLDYTAIELEHILQILSEYPSLLERVTFCVF